MVGLLPVERALPDGRATAPFLHAHAVGHSTLLVVTLKL